MSYFKKEILKRVIALILSATVSLLVENIYENLLGKYINESNILELSEKMTKTDNDKEIIGIYNEIIESTAIEVLFIFPDKTWVIVTRGCFGGSFWDEGIWVRNNDQLMLISNDVSQRTNSRLRFYWLVNNSSESFLMGKKYHDYYLQHKDLSLKDLPYYKREQSFASSSYQSLKHEYIDKYWE